jgi:hypothetical protein
VAFVLVVSVTYRTQKGIDIAAGIITQFSLDRVSLHEHNPGVSPRQRHDFSATPDGTGGYSKWYVAQRPFPATGSIYITLLTGAAQ